MDWHKTNTFYNQPSISLNEIFIGDIVYSLQDNKEGKITKIISSSEIKVSFSSSKWDYKYRPLESLSKKINF